MTARLHARMTCAAVLLFATGCATNSADWFEPDWDRVLVQRGELGQMPEAGIPAAALNEPQDLPDFSAPGPHELFIEQSVFASLRQNRDLSVAQYVPVITQAFEQIERGVFDPELFASAAFTREQAQETARSTGAQFGVVGDDASLEAGVRQTLPTGTTVELGVTQDRSISNRAPEQQAARVGLGITQSLLRGFGPAVNLASVRQAELETAISRYELRAFVESLVAQTEVAYWRYLLAQRKIEIFERSLDVARQQADQIDQRIEVGVLPRTESAAARSEVALREQALIDARSELRAARMQLLRAMGSSLEHAEEVAIDPVSAPTFEGEELGDASDRVRIAAQLRPELAEARLRLDQKRLETVRTRNGLLPRLDFFIAFGKTGYADTFDTSFRELDGPNHDWTVGATLSQAIGRTTARGQHAAAVASRQQSAAAIDNLSQLVELDVRLAVNGAQRAREQIAATATTRQLQEQTAQAEQERFDVGSSTALLVAQAQRDLLAARIAEVEAIINYRIALVQLYLAEGSLLERRGVQVTTPQDRS